MYLLKSLGIRHVHALTHQRNHFPTRSYCQTQSWGINVVYFPWTGRDQTFTAGWVAVAIHWKHDFAHDVDVGAVADVGDGDDAGAVLTCADVIISRL